MLAAALTFLTPRGALVALAALVPLAALAVTARRAERVARLLRLDPDERRALVLPAVLVGARVRVPRRGRGAACTADDAPAGRAHAVADLLRRRRLPVDGWQRKR